MKLLGYTIENLIRTLEIGIKDAVDSAKFKFAIYGFGTYIAVVQLNATR
jgi:hypothetical protein